MGYFGAAPFENDRALDWVSAFRGKLTLPRVRKALTEFLQFEPKDTDPLSSEDIEIIISSLKSSYQRNPPKACLDSGQPLAVWLERWEREIREHYKSGRYLDEEYGPAEEAIAAAAITAALAGYIDGAPQDVLKLTAARPAPTKELVELAIAALDKALTSPRYRRMREFYLDAFPESSGGYDGLLAVRKLRDRLGDFARA